MTNGDQSPDQSSGIGSKAIRFTFSYEGSQVQLVSVAKVAIRSQPSDPGEIQEGQSGFWFELRDKEGKVLYRLFVFNPIRFISEALSNEPDDSIRTVKIGNPKGAFELVSPEIGEAETIVLFSSPFELERAGEPARELARFQVASENKDKGSQS